MINCTLFAQPNINIDGELVTDFLSNKVRAVLFRLAYAEGAIPRSQLATLCWGDVPEKTAAKNLRQALYDIQKRIPLAVTRQTVALHGQVDTRAFIAAIADGDDEQATALYAGDLLADFVVDDAPDFMAWLAQERGRLRGMMLGALRRLLLAGERPRWSRSQWLRKLVEIEPSAENEQRQLIELLASQRSFDDALAQYERLRAALEPLGVVPTVETEKLVSAIRRVRERGQQDAVEIVGRSAELTQLQAWLDDGERLITLCGTGGIGKTHLARALAATANPLLDVRFVALADATTFADALTTIATTFGLPPQSPDQLLSQLSGVLILDNCEQLMSDAFIDWVVDAMGHVQVVLTSRERLFLRDERVLLLDGMRDETEAVALFVRSARRVDPAFAPDHAAIAAIAEQVDGLPLALEIAGSLVGRYIVAEIAAQIGQIETTRADLPVRQRSIAAVFDYSWRLLDSAERALFANLAIFNGSFDLAAAQAITNAKPTTLRALLHKSLIQFDPASGRYTLHALLRDYAAQMQSAAAPHQAYRAYYIQFLADRSERLQAGERDVLQACAVEYPNIRAVWLSACAAGDQMMLLRGYLPLTYFLEEAGRYREAQQLFGAALAIPNLQPFLTAAFALALANSGERLREYDRARQLVQQGLATARALKIDLGITHGLLLLGRIDLAEGKGEGDVGLLESAETHLTELTGYSLSPPFALTVARGLLRLGETQFALSKHDAATTTLYTALPHLPKRGAMYAHLHLGALLQDDGHWQQALQLADELDHPRLKVEVRLAILPHLLDRGELARADTMLEEVLKHPAWLAMYRKELTDIQNTLTLAR